MKTVLVISNSAENTEYDLERSISTIKGYGMDPLAVMPAIFETDGTSQNFDVDEMIDYVFDECEASAVSIGYITDPDIYVKLAEKLREHRRVPVVLRPSLISKTGSLLVDEDTFYTLQDEVMPLAAFVIVNCLEAEALSGMTCVSKEDYEKAAEKIYSTFGCHVIILNNEKTLGETLVYSGEDCSWLRTVNRELPDKDISTAVACGLADGNDMEASARRAYEFVYGPIREKREVGVSLPSINRTPVPSLARFSFSFEGKKAEEAASEPKPAVSEPEPAAAEAAPVKEASSAPADTPREEAVKPVATASSLVSPAKPLREIARRLDADRASQKNEEQKGVTSSLLEALNARREARRLEVGDITPSPMKKDRENGSGLQDKDQINRLSGEG